MTVWKLLMHLTDVQAGLQQKLREQEAKARKFQAEAGRLAELLSKDAARIEKAEDLAEQHSNSRRVWEEILGTLIVENDRLKVSSEYTAKLEALLKEIGSVTTPVVDEGDVFLWLTPSENSKDEDEENWLARRDVLLEEAPDPSVP